MIVNSPEELARNLRELKEKKRVLLATGALCDEIELDGKKLLDYAAELALKLDVPVAATGNTVRGLRERGVEKTKKIFVAELLEFLRSKWLEPLMPERPEVLILVGYTPEITRRLLTGLKDVETAVLGPAAIPEASYSLPDMSLKQWAENLERLVKSL